MDTLKQKFGLTGSQLKWLAIISMFCDHAAKIIQIHLTPTASISADEVMTFYSYYSIITSIMLFLGRLAFPIFCFLMVEGFMHTSNVKKYALRLAAFALISEVPFDLAFFHKSFYLYGQNVFFTLLIGLITIYALQKVKELELSDGKNLLLSLLVTLAGIVIAEVMHTDYGGWIGVLLIVMLYSLYEFPLLKCLFGALIILQSSLIGMLAFIPIYFYNGKRGRQWKYFFYVFYPAHLLLLVVLQTYVIGPYLANLTQVIP